MLKIFEKPSPDAEPATYTFHFHTSEAKSEAQAVKDLLARLLADIRSKDPSIPKPSGTATPGSGTPSGQNGQPNGSTSGGGGSSSGGVAGGAAGGATGGGSASGSMAFSSTVNSQDASSSLRWYDDAQLKNDIELQQSLMKSDPSLHQTYMDGLKTKPDTISGSAFNSQFWSTRLSALRAHAIESRQRKGPINAISNLKPKLNDKGEYILDMTRDKINMINAQHPLLRRIYDENVPRVNESSFWVRFFNSRLCKRLKGESVSINDPSDPLFDNHDPSENYQSFQSKVMAASVPAMVDIEANEENQGGVRSGNVEQYKENNKYRSRVPIAQSLNHLSDMILSNTAPSDSTRPDQARSSAYAEIALRDLSGDPEQARIMLNVKEQNKFFSKNNAAPSKLAEAFAKQDASDVLFEIQGDLETLQDDGKGGIDLQTGIGFNDHSDSDDDSDDDADPGSGGKKKGKKKGTHVGSRSALRDAEKDIMLGILQHRTQKFGDASLTSATPMGLPAHLAEQAAMTHATTLEFLHQFWTAFLSGDPDRAAELQHLAESLARSALRIEAVAADAEAARDDVIRKRKKEIIEHHQRTGKKLRWRPEMTKGGRDAVEKLLGPTKDALAKAQGDYARALAAEGLKQSTEQ